MKIQCINRHAMKIYNSIGEITQEIEELEEAMKNAGETVRRAISEELLKLYIKRDSMLVENYQNSSSSIH